MTSLFISYAREDLDRVLILKGLIEPRGEPDDHEAWLDMEDLPPASLWREQIRKAIDRADVFVLALSPASLASSEVAKELDYALQQHKRVVPVAVGDVEPEATDPRIREIDWVWFRPDDDREGAIDRLHRAITQDLEHLERHTRFLLSAQQWTESGQLLSGRALREAEQWLAVSRDLEPAPLQLHYDLVAASQARRRQWRIAATVGGAVLALALLLGSKALQERQARIDSQALAERSTTADRVDDALLLAVEAQSRTRTSASLGALVAGLQRMPHLYRMLHGSEQELEAVAFHPTQGVVAGAGSDGLIRFWDSSTWLPVGEPIEASEDRVTALGFSPDGRFVLSGGWDGVLRVWDWQERVQIAEHDSLNLALIEAMAIHPEAPFVAVGYANGAALWAWGSEARETPLTDSGRRVNAVAFDRRGSRLAIVEGTEFVHVWDFDNGRLGEVYTVGHPGTTSMTFLDEARLLLGSDNGTVEATGLAPDALPWTWGSPVHGAVLSLAVAADGETVAAGGSGVVRVWNKSTRAAASSLEVPGRLFHLAFAPDSRLLASAGSTPPIRVWDPYQVAPLKRALFDARSSVQRLAVSDDGRNVVAGTLDGGVFSIPVDRPASFHEIDTGEADLINSVAGVGETIFWADESGRVLRWSPETAEARDIFDAGAEVTAIAASDRVLAVGTATGELWLVDDPLTDDAQPIQLPAADTFSYVMSLEISPDGKVLFAGDNAGNMVTYRTHSREVLAQSRMSGTPVDASFSPGGSRTLVIADYGGSELLILDARDFERHDTMRTACGQASAIAFRPDGRLLAVGCKSGDLELFNWADRQRIARFEGDGHAIDDIVMLGGGANAVTTTDDGRLFLWDFDEMSWMRKACRRANRLADPTAGERCRELLGGVAPEPLPPRSFPGPGVGPRRGLPDFVAKLIR